MRIRIKEILKHQRFLVVTMFFLVLIVLVAIASNPFVKRYFLLQTAQGQSGTLELATEGLRLTLDRYARIPALIAARPEISSFLSNTTSETLKEQAESLLSETANALGADGVYLEDATGKLLAKSNRSGVRSEVENEGYYRPYFDRVIAGGIGQYFAMSTQNGQRGYFYAAPVRSAGRIKGVVAVRFIVNQFEASLREGNSEVIVRDSNDIVFISSRNEWNLKALTRLSQQKRDIIASAAQYPLNLLEYLPNEQSEFQSNISLIKIETSDGPLQYIATTMLIARAGWRVTILTPTRPATVLAVLTAGSIIISALLVAAIALLIRQRQVRLSEKLAAENRAKIQLEQKVTERTSELNHSNTLLIAEVEERKNAELRLRKTQTELIQAGKLAALGQMSAAISHEFNQPLAATKAYAENAGLYLERDRKDKATENITHIVSMVDRMSSIAKYLRNFARMPQDRTKPILLSQVLNSVCELMRPQITAAGINFKFERPDDALFVTGGDVRLQQVIVNLLRNSLDAVENVDQPAITLRTQIQDEKVDILVQDNGSGIPDETLNQIFDPFFSTKQAGQGMGLGLSISYNIIKDFGGEISATNSSNGGAVFKVTLMIAKQEDVNEAAQ